jgi:hypothetical protein
MFMNEDNFDRYLFNSNAYEENLKRIFEFLKSFIEAAPQDKDYNIFANTAMKIRETLLEKNIAV